MWIWRCAYFSILIERGQNFDRPIADAANLWATAPKLYVVLLVETHMRQLGALRSPCSPFVVHLSHLVLWASKNLRANFMFFSTRAYLAPSGSHVQLNLVGHRSGDWRDASHQHKRHARGW